MLSQRSARRLTVQGWLAVFRSRFAWAARCRGQGGEQNGDQGRQRVANDWRKTTNLRTSESA